MEQEPDAEDSVERSLAKGNPGTELRKRRSGSNMKEDSDSGFEPVKQTKEGVKRRASSEAGRATKDQAGKYLRGAFAVLLLLVLVFDWIAMGFRKGSTSFVDWWDMIGTASYLRSRNERYSLRQSNLLRKPGQVLLVMLDSYVLYDIAGKTCRSLMRHSLQVPNIINVLEYIVYGMLPVHFMAGDHLFHLIEHNDLHQGIVCAFWGLTKARSLNNVLTEAMAVHRYSLPQAFALCVLSCEVGTVWSRVTTNLVAYPLEECARRFPRGLLRWLTGRALLATLCASTFMVLAVKLGMGKIPFVWALPNFLAYLALFYRYGHGTIERVIRESGAASIVSPRAVEERVKAVSSLIASPESSRDLVTGALQETLLGESIKLGNYLLVGIDQLSADGKQDISEVVGVLETLANDQAVRKRSKRKDS